MNRLVGAILDSALDSARETTAVILTLPLKSSTATTVTVTLEGIDGDTGDWGNIDVTIPRVLPALGGTIPATVPCAHCGTNGVAGTTPTPIVVIRQGYEYYAIGYLPEITEDEEP